MCSCRRHLQSLPYRVVARGVEAVKRGSAISGNVRGDLRHSFAASFRAANFDQVDFIGVGELVLRRGQAFKASVAGLGRCWRIGAQVSDQEPGKERLAVGNHVEYGELHLSGLFMNRAGDFHG